MVDTEGFVLKAKVHSAKVMDYEGIKTLLCAKRTSNFPVSLSCGWMPATEEKTRVRTGWRRSSDGTWSSSSVHASLLPKRCSDVVGSGVEQRGRGRRLGEAIAPRRLSGFAEEVGGRTHVFLNREEQEDE
jgi:hypothetical protein